MQSHEAHRKKWKLGDEFILEDAPNTKVWVTYSPFHRDKGEQLGFLFVNPFSGGLTWQEYNPCDDD